VNGRSQERVHGALAAFEDRGTAGWVRARVANAAPGVRLERAIVAMSHYVIDELTWDADHDVEVDLPMHVDGELTGVGPWRREVPDGGTDTEDGFRFLTETETAASVDGVRLRAQLGDASADAYVVVDTPHAWWRAVSFGAPGSGPARFHFVRARGRRGRILSVWDVLGVVRSVTTAGTVARVELRDGTVHQHERLDDHWRFQLVSTTVPTIQAMDLGTIDLAGGVNQLPMSEPRVVTPRRRVVVPRRARGSASGGRALTFELGEEHYRRSEPTWAEAGKPSATVSIAADGDDLVITVDVSKSDLHFAPACPDNPLDNEHPDTNSDGVQLHLILPVSPGERLAPREVTWLLVPEDDTDRVRVTTRTVGGDAPRLRASWRRTSAGYSIRAAISLLDLTADARTPIHLGLIVNDMAPDRERRRGQLVLGGGPGEFVYLRGDRLPPEAHLEVVIGDG
jgi:hypothetical protein